jgi:hypothetical protein
MANARAVSILTFVTNGQGVGPGHSAIQIENKCYSFENANDWFSWKTENSGWKILNVSDYYDKNAWRPILRQRLNQKCYSESVIEYINKSIKNDDDYISSGVCSTLVSKAINYALPAEIIFDPKGIDTPFGVFHCARRLGLVLSEDYTWADHLAAMVEHRQQAQRRISRRSQEPRTDAWQVISGPRRCRRMMAAMPR